MAYRQALHLVQPHVDYIRYDSHDTVVPRRLSMIHVKKNKFWQNVRATVATFALLTVCGAISGVIGWYCYLLDDPRRVLTTHKVAFSVNDRILSYLDGTGSARLRGHLGRGISWDQLEFVCDGYLYSGGICVEWEYGPKVFVDHIRGNCYNVSWQTTRCSQDYYEDCFSLDDHWYGGFTADRQPWPLDTAQLELVPMILGTNQLGVFQNPYWLSSGGFSIHVTGYSLLSASVNSSGDGLLCIRSTRRGHGTELPNLRFDYTICKSSNIKDRHKEHIKTSYHTSKYALEIAPVYAPLWSADGIDRSKGEEQATSSSLQNFQKILARCNFTRSLVLLPDFVWHYDVSFEEDIERHLGRTLQTATLSSRGEDFLLAAAVEPCLEVTPEVLKKRIMSKYFLKDSSNTLSRSVARAGKICGVLDLESGASLAWLQMRLSQIKQNLGVKYFVLQEDPVSSILDLVHPTEYLHNFLGQLLESGNQVISSFGVLDVPQTVWFSMLRRNFTWDNLPGLIPEALTMSLLGFGLLIPPSIPHDVRDHLCHNISFQDRELYIRWLQATVLFPSFKFPEPCLLDTVAPTLEKMLKVRQKLLPLLSEEANDVGRHGGGIVWPLWWIAPSDSTALSVEDQYVIGESVVVAPVLNYGQLYRDIYLPDGHWWDILQDEPIRGPTWLRDYHVPLENLAHFSKIN